MVRLCGIQAAPDGPVRLLLCSNGAIHKDGLEDFADFYKSGCFGKIRLGKAAASGAPQSAESINVARTPRPS